MNAIKQYFSNFKENSRSHAGLGRNFKYLWAVMLVVELAQLATGASILSFVIGILTVIIMYLVFGADDKEIVFRVTNKSPNEYFLHVYKYNTIKTDLRFRDIFFKLPSSPLDLLFYVGMMVLLLLSVLLLVTSVTLAVMGHPLVLSSISMTVSVALYTAVLSALAISRRDSPSKTEITINAGRRENTYSKE